MTYVPSKSQIADVLTKGIPREDFENYVDKLGMIDIYAQLEGECWKVSLVRLWTQILEWIGSLV